MIITLKGANFSASNIGTLNTYSIRFSGNITNSNTSVDRDENTGYSTTLVLVDGYELNGSITVTMGGTDITSTAVSGMTITIANKVTGNVVITVPTKKIAAEEPETPTNYTFTINPDPTSATVTLSATGYSTVSGTGSKSITVVNGTVVTWSVSASGYIEQNGTWTANGSDESKSVTLVEAGGDQVITFALGSALSYDTSTKTLSSNSSSNILAKNDTQKWIMQQPLVAGNEIEFDIIGTSTEGAGMYTVGLATTNNLETAMTTDTISTGNYNILSGIVGVYKDNKSASVTKLQCFATVPSTTLPKKPYAQDIPTTATVNYKIKRAADGTISIFVNDTQLTTSDTGIQGAFTAAKETAILYLCGHCTAAKESKDQRTVVFKYFGELR